MKKTAKILALVLALVMMFAMASMFTASAASIPGGTKLYLVPSANWNQSNARFAAYFFGDGEAWVSMTKVEGESNLYEVTVPAGKNFTNVIFCRMNPNAAANNWNNKWNQTSDLVYNGTSNCYTVKEGTWDNGAGTWSTYGNSCAHANVGPAATCTTAQECLDCGDPVASALGHEYNADHKCSRCNNYATFTVAGTGAHLGTEWDTGNVANDMTYADGVYTKVYENVAAGTYKFKCAMDHEWGTAYPDADKSFTVSTAGSTVTITLKGTTVDVKVEAPHTHVWSDATCTEPKKCECNATEGEALGHAYAEGVCSRCGAADPDYVAPQEPAKDVYVNISHLENGTTTGEELVAGTGISASSGLAIEGNGKEIDGFTFTTRLKLGGTMKVSDGVVTAGIKIVTDGPGKLVVYAISSSKDTTRTLRLTTLVDGAFVDVAVDENVLGSEIVKCEFDIPAAGTYYLGSKSSGINLYYLAVNHSHVYAEGACACGAADPDFVPPHEHNFVEGKCECGESDPNYVPPHVNALVVGETNKIVIDSDQNNGYGYYIELVAFAVEEAGYYTFAGEGVTIWIYDVNNTLVSMTGAANLEPGYYGIFIAANEKETTGEYNVAVTKAAWVNALVEGATSKINITDALNNGAGYYITWVEFKVTEAGHYAFTGTDALAWIFSSDYQTLLCGMSGAADLQPGTYQICVAPLATNTTGMFNITVTKTEITTGGGDDVDPPVDPEPAHGEQKLVIGDNTIVIDGCTLNGYGNAVEWLPFEVTETATYNITSADLTLYILTAKDMLNADAYVSTTGMAQLEAGVTYYILAGNNGVKGTFTVNVEKIDSSAECEHEWVDATCKAPKTCKLCGASEGEANPDAHVLFADTCLLCGKDVPSFKAGDNHVIYVPGAANLMANGDLYGKIEITEAGTYVITGGAAEMIKVYVWSIPVSGLENGQLTMDTPYAFNIDAFSETGLVNSFEITLPEAGIYWIGFAFDLRGEGHEGCEFDINISLKEEEPVDPSEPTEPSEPSEPTDPDDGKVEEPAELNFFQKIIQMIKDLLAKFLAFFKRFGI